MTNAILEKYIQNHLISKGWDILSGTDVQEGYDIALTRKHISKNGTPEDSHSTVLLIKKHSEFYSYVKFQILKPNKEIYSETKDLAIEAIDERITAVASELFKKNNKTLRKDGVFSKRN